MAVLYYTPLGLVLISCYCYCLITLLVVPNVVLVVAFSVTTPSTSVLQQPQIVEVPRMSVEEFATYWRTLQQKQRQLLHDGKLLSPNDNNNNVQNEMQYRTLTPILVSGALSIQQCESIGSQFIELAQQSQQNDTTTTSGEGTVQQQYVTLQRRRNNSNERKRRSLRKQSKQQPSTTSNVVSSYNVSLLQAIDTIMTQSHHDDAFWCFEEGLLERQSRNNNVNGNDETDEENSTFRRIHDVVQSIRQSLLQGGCSGKQHSENDHDSVTTTSRLTNWFDYFPKWAQSTDCVVLSGIGSTSTLHRDPFEWTGTSTCIEGSKIWRFVMAPPTTTNNNDDVDQSSSSSSSLEEQLLSYRLPSVAWNDDNDTTTTISAGWQSDLSLYRTIGRSDNDNISSCIGNSSCSSREERYHDILRIAMSLEILQPDHELQPLLSTLTTAPTPVIWTTVQLEGDVVIIPSQYWHQTYTLCEATMTISSQHCADTDIDRVLSHIVTTTAGTSATATTTTNTNTNTIDIHKLLYDGNDTPQERIRQFFQQLQAQLE